MVIHLQGASITDLAVVRSDRLHTIACGTNFHEFALQVGHELLCVWQYGMVGGVREGDGGKDDFGDGARTHEDGH
jgi:hypothetical protein